MGTIGAIFFSREVYISLVSLCQLFDPLIKREETGSRAKKNQDVMNYCDHWSLLLFRSANPFSSNNNAKKKREKHTQAATKKHQDVMNTRPINPGEAERAGLRLPKNCWWIGSGKYRKKCTKKSSFGIIAALIFPDFVNRCVLKLDSCFNVFFFCSTIFVLCVCGTIYVSLSIPFPVSKFVLGLIRLLLFCFWLAFHQGFPFQLFEWVVHLGFQSRGIPVVQHNFPCLSS